MNNSNTNIIDINVKLSKFNIIEKKLNNIITIITNCNHYNSNSNLKKNELLDYNNNEILNSNIKSKDNIYTEE